MSCFKCLSKNLSQNHGFVQTKQTLEICSSCLLRILYQWFGSLHSTYLVFQPQASYYQAKITHFLRSKLKKSSYLPAFNQLTGACSYCTFEQAKAFWYPHSQNEFINKPGERLGRRCIYANLHKLLKTSHFLVPEVTYPNWPPKLLGTTEENLVGIIEFSPLSQKSFEKLTNFNKKDS